jgi:8-oxo-dGTP pyrophosphatase MutT (NUDIX family)
MSPTETRAWIVSRLDPIESYDPTTRKVSSDSELNPDFPRYTKPLNPAAVLVPLIEHEKGMTVLLTRRSDSLRNHTGQVAFPGGRCDPGETPWETAIREAWEEVGLDPGHVEIAGLSTALQTGAGFDITPVVAFVRPGFTLKPNPDEVADVFEAPFSFLMDPSSYELRSMVAASGATRRFYAAPYEEQLIWGATATMLRKLYERLYGPQAE